MIENKYSIIFKVRSCIANKYEYIYLNPVNGSLELYQGVRKYITFYNEESRHSNLVNLTLRMFWSSENESKKHLIFTSYCTKYWSSYAVG